MAAVSAEVLPGGMDAVDSPIPLKAPARGLMHTVLERRLEPLGNSFLNWVDWEGEDCEPLSAKSRARSSGGIVSRSLRNSATQGTVVAKSEGTPADLKASSNQENKAEQPPTEQRKYSKGRPNFVRNRPAALSIAKKAPAVECVQQLEAGADIEEAMAEALKSEIPKNTDLRYADSDKASSSCGNSPTDELSIWMEEPSDGEESSWAAYTQSRLQGQAPELSSPGVQPPQGDSLQELCTPSISPSVVEARLARLRGVGRRHRKQMLNMEGTEVDPGSPGSPYSQGSSLSPQIKDNISSGGSDIGSGSDSQEPVKSKVTTLMIQNIPTHVSQWGLAAAMDWSGFRGLYDFLYLPTAFKSCTSQGYAFVNFVDAAVARRLRHAWDRRQPFGRGAGKALHIVPAVVQGKEANIARWSGAKMRRVRNPEHRPLVQVAQRVRDGQQLSGGQLTDQPQTPPMQQQKQTRKPAKCTSP